MNNEEFWNLYVKEVTEASHEEQAFENIVEEKPKCYGAACMTCDCYELCH